MRGSLWLFLIGFATCRATAIAAEADIDAEQVATIDDVRINESSGIALSRRTDNALWLHNDSGDEPRLFLVGLDGSTKCILDVKKADAVDWEDMCSFTVDGEDWLLIADVGDNSAKRSSKKKQCRLYLLKEPDVPDGAKRLSRAYDVRIRFDYDDGPHNCESVAVDAERREILLLTKESPLSCGLYRLPLDLKDDKQSETAERIADLPIPFSTAMDISRDGRRLAVVTMWAGWICEREETETWADALSSRLHHVRLPPRRQGETVCFSRDGGFLFLNSEHKQQPLWRLRVEFPSAAQREQGVPP